MDNRDQDDREELRLFTVFRASVLAVAALGTVLSLLLAGTSCARLRGRAKVLCCCTVPRLSLALVLLHHAPMFCLTTFADVTFAEDKYTVAGLINICVSMLALVNALGTTRCGEGFYTAWGEDGSCGPCGPCGESWSGRESGGTNDLELPRNKDEGTGGSLQSDERTVAINYTEMP